MLITFPKESTIIRADEIIRLCGNALRTKQPLTFSLKETIFIDPFAVSVLAGVIKQCKKTRNRKILYNPPENAEVDKYLSQIGFKAFFKINGPDIHRDTTVQLRQLNAIDPIYIENLIILIDSKMRLSEGIKDSFKMSLNEVLTNVFDHSKSADGCFLCAQYYPSSKLIRLCIIDFGVGILTTLKTKYGIWTDIDAIKLSVKEGITSRPQSAGFGLFHIRNFLKVNEGTLTLISGKGKVDFRGNKIATHRLSSVFKGTIVNLLIKANKRSFYFLSDEKDYIF